MRWGNRPAVLDTSPTVTPPLHLMGLAYSTVMLSAAVRPRTYQPSPFWPIDRTR
jgi:hypothetical protein